MIEIGTYEISKRSDGTFWIEHESGEGMQVSERALFELIHQFYKKNF